MRYITPSLPDRIGHLTLEVDCFLKERVLDNDRSPFTLVLPKATANPAMRVLLADFVGCKDQALRTLAGRVITPEEVPAGAMVEGLHRYAALVDGTALCYDVYRRWGDRSPLLRFEEPFATPVPAEKWVCVHSREGGYSPGDEHCHSYRNSTIRSCVPAMRWLVSRGYTVFRMGDPTMAPLPEEPGIIDYAHAPYRSPEMDLWLLQGCDFFLGCTSGLSVVASAFGRPCALANAAPLDCVYGLGPRDLSIHKHFLRQGWRIPPKDLLATPIGSFRYTAQYQTHGLWVQENTGTEILNLTMEMVEGPQFDASEQQEEFRSWFHPGHYSYGSAANICSAFLGR